ncbi:S-layer homology domain-containing protein [Leptolyngbya ohadii]|uniref:S-layer homology domain-containing protein n=1 Tax=Leptolyngbya ohadii TaxID=1962290 RepID=UPI000B59F1D8|nr:S-layer homology domain-containing protein [Leptolyngbya ohadii]
MTARPPSDPRPSRKSPLDFDEFVAVLVAFASLGTVLAWGLTRSNESFLSQTGLFPIPNFAEGQSQTPTAGDRDDLLIAPPAAGGQRITPPISQPASPVNPLPEAIAPRTPVAVVPLPVPLPQGQTNQPAAVEENQNNATAPSSLETPFSDVPSTYWAAPFIAALSQRGDISGFNDGTFRPDQPVTRAEFATLIQNTFDQPAQQSPIAFQDVPGNLWAAGAIDSAVQTGFLKGFPDGTFQPDLQIPRVQALTALTSGLKLAPTANPEQTLQLFRDRDQLPNWSIPVAAAATEAGLVVNHPSPDILNPNQPATRAEVAAFLYQALVSQGQVPPISSNSTSQYIVRP